MSETTTLEAPAKAKASWATWLVRAGLCGLLAITAVAAFYNVTGWLHRGFVELAAFAFVTEFVALAMAAVAEHVWESKRAKAVRRTAVFVLLATAIGSEVFNGFSGLLAWQDTQAERAETLVEPQRNAIAAEEARLQAAIGEANARIDAAQARIDAVAKPDCAGAGPLTCAARTAAYDAQIGADGAQKAAETANRARFEEELRSLDRTVELPAPPFSDHAVIAFLAFLGFVKVCGPWAVMVALNRSAAPKGAKTERKSGSNGTERSNVVPFRSRKQQKRIVLAMLAAGVSFRDTEKETGVPLATLHRWKKAAQ